jgi:hypothetical protein
MSTVQPQLEAGLPTAIINKSDSEWRALLSPEQVRTHFILVLKQYVEPYGEYSSGFSVRKALSPKELASTKSTQLQVYTIAPDAKHLCTKVLPNSMYV